MVILKKRVIALFTAAAVACTSTTASASGHEYWEGHYLNELQKDLCFVYLSSAVSEYFNKEIFDKIYYWNDVSSNVHVSVMSFAEYESSLNAQRNRPSVVTQTPYIIGKNTSELKGAYGKTMLYDAKGKLRTSDEDVKANLNLDWSCVQIWLNTDSKVFASNPRPLDATQKVFLHEVGHALKLSHPVKDSSLEYHYIDGYPFSVMNQGLPYDYDRVCVMPTIHDRLNLIEKWGE